MIGMIAAIVIVVGIVAYAAYKFSSHHKKNSELFFIVHHFQGAILRSLLPRIYGSQTKHIYRWFENIRTSRSSNGSVFVE